MKKHRLLELVTVILILGVFYSGCGRRLEEEPHKMPNVRPPDISKAIAIPQVPYLVIPNELVVLLKEDNDADSFVKTIKDTEIKVVGYIPSFRIVQIEVPSDKRDDIKAELEKNPIVEVVVYQGVFKNDAKLNDPVFHNDDLWDDWGLQSINAPQAWDITRGDPNVIIGVVDGGMLLSHEEIKDKIYLSSSSFSDDGTHAGDEERLFHGTLVSIIATGSGDNGVGTSGVAPGCKLMPVQVGMSLSDGLAGVAYAVKNGAKVVNLSIGPAFLEGYIESYQVEEKRSSVLGYFLGERQKEIEFANEVFGLCELAGATIVIAAGNDNIPVDFNAWAYNYFTLGIGAVGGDENSKLIPADFTNYGYMTRVSAPGVNIYSGSGQQGGKGYTWADGTSVAAPYVTGVAALIISVNPKLTPLEVRQIIIASAFPEGTQKEGGLGWFKKDMRGAREIERWRKAFLLLLGKDENLLLHGVAQQFMASLIPIEYNEVWKGGKDKAVGGFIDAKRALEMAKDGSFRNRFAVFTNEDSKKAEGLSPERLLWVYDMLKFRNRYSASLEVPAFELKLSDGLNRLIVIRDKEPGQDYSEWLEYVKPGIYRHFAKLGGEDYSQGVVELIGGGEGFKIKNIRRKLERPYVILKETSTPDETAGTGFYTIAGGNEPNRIGKLAINYIGPKGGPEQEEFYAYQEGAEYKPENILYTATTGSEVEMITGRYNLVILSRPGIWFKAVDIKEGETTKLEAGGYGKIVVAGNNPAGELVKASMFLYASKGKEAVLPGKDEALTTGTTNVAIDVVEGNYFIYVDLDPDITYDDVRVRRGQTTTLELPRRGRINIAAKDLESKPLRITYWIYEKGTWDKMIESGYTNAPVDLPPGEYNVYVNSDPDIKYENVKIKPGEATEFALPEYGALLVKGLDASGKPLYYTSIYLYHTGGKDIVSSGRVSERLNLFAGEYDLEVDLNPDIDYKKIKIEPAKVLEIELPRWGELVTNVKDRQGKSPYYIAYLYRSKEDKEWVASSSDKRKLVPPGTYFVFIDTGWGWEDAWVNRPVNIKAGEKSEVNVTLKESR